MSGRPEMSTTLQDPNVEHTSSASPVIALIGPNATHRRVMAKALSNSDAGNVREFIDYPANLGDVPHLLEEKFDFVMIDVDSDQSYALQIIESIAAHNSTVVMAYSMRNDAELIRECMRAGARDFLPLPEDASLQAEPEPVPEPPAAPVARRAPEPAPAPLPVPEPVVLPEPVAVRELSPEAPPEPALNPSDFLRRAESQAEPVQPEEPPLNPADFLLATPREVTESTPAPSFPPQEYSVPSRPQFVEPRKSAPPPESPSAYQAAFQPLPKPVVQPSRKPIHLPPAQAAEGRHPDPASHVLPEELRGANPAAKAPKEEPRKAAAKDEIDAWDSLWIKPALAGAAKPQEPSAAPAPEAPARKQAAGIPSGPQLVPRSAAAPKAEAPTAAAPAAPMFRGVDSDASAQTERPWMRWAILGGIAVAIAAAILLVFMPSHRASAPAPAPQAQPTAAQTQPADTETAAPANVQPIAKPSAGTPAKAGQDGPAPVSSAMMDQQLNAPTRISGALHKSAQQADEPPPSGFTTGGIESSGSLPGQVFDASKGVKVVPGISAISAGVADGMLIHRTAPVYPEIAKTAHLSGTVVLGANITKSGSLTNLHVLSGPAMLRGAALEAVKTWRYRPYLLDNQPVEVGTTIRVVFSLDR